MVGGLRDVLQALANACNKGLKKYPIFDMFGLVLKKGHNEVPLWSKQPLNYHAMLVKNTRT